MPTIGVLLSFSAATALLVTLPGPNLLYIVGNGISGGRRAALASALMAEPPDPSESATSPRPISHLLGRGVVVNVLNPKVSMLFLAFLPQFIEPALGRSATQILVLGATFFVIALAIDLVYAIGSGALGRWLDRRPLLYRRQERIAGLVYLGLAGVAATQRTNR